MQEQDVDNEPAHHARRPMNAFLIFCKRHRSVVRDKYPNLENRSITKILGEWWANLEKEEKASYTGLAKQYKDAFFSANPDFKWYKLPAPPLRTLASRPREPTEKTLSPAHEFYPDTELEKTNNNSTKVDFNKKPRDNAIEDPKPLSMFTPGKLADEAHMGGISRLLDAKTETSTPNPYYSPTPIKVGAISNEYRSHNLLETKNITSREDNIRELQNALSETTKVFEEDFDENQARIYRHGVPSDMFTRQHVIDQVVDKQYNKDDEYGYPRNWSDDEKTRSGRSCKGKRYQEFMAVGGLMASKRQRRDYRDNTPEDNYNASCSWDAALTCSEDSALADGKKQSSSEIPAETEPTIDSINTSEQDNNSNKTFKAADFDLDGKIAALPTLSLEKFQQRKRENKRRKKTINLKPKVLGSSHIINSVPNYDHRREMAENWRETVIGSQKRKPRKVSITRFEINSLVSAMEASDARKVSPEIKIATEAPYTVVQSMEICKQPPQMDLLALATLAEVASNTSKIDEPVDSYPYRASDDNISTI